MELEQSTPISEIKGQVRDYNYLKNAGAYNDQNVGIKHGDKDEDNSPKNVNNVRLLLLVI